MKANDIISSMEQWAPTSLAYAWDKIGLATGHPNQEVKKVLTTLTITRDAFIAAKRAKAQMIVSHHPLIWESIATLREDIPQSKLVLDIAQAGIACFSAHTNLDVTPGGVNHILADRIGLKNIQPLFKIPQATQSKLVIFVPESYFIRVREAVFAAGAGGIGDYTECSYSSHGHGTFRPHENAKPFAGRIGKLNEEPEIRFETLLPSEHKRTIVQALREAHPYEEPAFDIIPLEIDNPVYSLGLQGELRKRVSLDTFAKQVKHKLEITHVRVSGNGKDMVKQVAVMGGAGGDSADDVPANIDVFVTGDVKYHKALDALDAGLNIIDAGHHGTEKWIVPAMADYLKSSLKGLRVATYMEPDPFRVL
ncbi:Nif3-like dinuclear metal center hexameric protein [bacterium AH-315-P07]|nr:Nif3-like dinuclear metal center hexameric protein [bacterium AH-315-P07]